MTDMRHRDGKLKIMHTIIGDFGKALRQIADLDEVESILTGTISPSKSYKETLTFQYFTDNGLKLLAKTTSAVQEIFVVTKVPDLLLDELRKMGFIDSEREDVHHNPPRRKKGAKHANAPHGEATDHAPATHMQKPVDRARGKTGGQNSSAGANASSDPLTLRQMLSSESISALMKLREETSPKIAPPPVKASGKKSKPQAVEEDFATLFSPKDEEESFEELLNKSVLDPKYFK